MWTEILSYSDTLLLFHEDQETLKTLFFKANSSKGNHLHQTRLQLFHTLCRYLHHFIENEIHCEIKTEKGQSSAHTFTTETNHIFT